MERTFVKDLNEGKDVLLKGWVFEIRELSKMDFILLRDMTGIVQCIAFEPEIMKKFLNFLLNLSLKLKEKSSLQKSKQNLQDTMSKLKLILLKLLARQKNCRYMLMKKLQRRNFSID